MNLLLGLTVVLVIFLIIYVIGFTRIVLTHSTPNKKLFDIFKLTIGTLFLMTISTLIAMYNIG